MVGIAPLGTNAILTQAHFYSISKNLQESGVSLIKAAVERKIARHNIKERGALHHDMIVKTIDAMMISFWRGMDGHLYNADSN